MQAGAKFTQNWKTASVRHYCGPRKFIPLAPLRSDRRDVEYLNMIHEILGRPTSKLSLGYEFLHFLNSIRNFRNSSPMRNFIIAYERELGRGSAVDQRVEDKASIVTGRGHLVSSSSMPVPPS
jgi:hypothetical protein